MHLLPLMLSLIAAADSGSSVLRVHPRDLRDLRTAFALSDDMWSHSVRNGQVDLRLSQEARSALERAGVPFEVLIDDVEGVIATQAAERADRARRAREGGQGGLAGEDWFADVKDLTAVEARLAELVAAHPALVSPITLGSSVEGRLIRGVRISLAPSGAEVPAFLFNACQHAREWATPMVAMMLAERLIDGSTNDPEIAAMLSASEVFIVPVANPDGYQYSWDQVRLWRKNRRDNGSGIFGVDLNRNWGYEWGGQGASANPNSETYRGPAPFSEPESQALRDFVLAHGRLLGHIDFHSYGELILWPWGWTTQLCEDEPLFSDLGAAMQAAVASVHGRVYTPGPIGTTLYLASGSSVDWVYATGGALSTTIEVRDTGDYGFLIPANEVRPCAEENSEAALSMMQTLLVPGFLAIEGAVPTTAAPSETTAIVVYASALASTFDGPPILHTRTGTVGIFTQSPMSALGSNRYSGDLPGAPCGAVVEWFVEWTGAPGSVRLPASAPTELFRTTIVAFETVFSDAFESDLGWVSGAPGDTATSGLWVRVDPVGTTAQPENDHTPEGALCWVTGQGAPGGAAGAADVDGGITTLTSPLLDGSDPDALLSYWRWYSNNLGAAPNADSMLVLVSTDGVTWNLLEEVSESATEWVQTTVRVGDFVQPAGPFRVRFVARDLGTGSLVEAAIDDLSIDALACSAHPADLNLDGQIDGVDLAMVLGSWGACAACPADIDGNGVVDGVDLALVLGAWS